MRWLLVLGLVAGCAKSEGPFDEGCDVPSDCQVVPRSCCGSCGQPTRDDVVAVHVDQAGAYRQSACDGPGDCPACEGEPDPSLLATCNAGRCEVVDLLAHVSAECAEASDCRVRTVDCCECGGDVTRTGLVAISSESDFSALVCDPGGAGCPECAPVYPDEAVAECSSGQCTLSWAE